MAVLTSAAVYYESAQSQQVFAAMTGNVARTTYTLTNKPWSSATGYEYTVAPYGLITGGVVIPAVAAGVNNVDVAALTAMMPAVATASATTGILSVNAAADVACTRGSAANVCIINSITITTAGAIAVVAGTATTAFSATRGAAGGPPSILLGSLEIGQVKLTTTAAAVIAASEIFQVVGDSQERYDYPVYSTDPINGQITFSAALPLIHATAAGVAASAAKLVYARVATPVFAEIPRARNFVPANTTNSTSSEQYYDGALGSFSSSIGQSQFECGLNDGVTDALLGKLGSNLLFKFMPDKNKAPYIITQGVLGATQAFSVGANPTATFTISPLQSSVRFAS